MPCPESSMMDPESLKDKVKTIKDGLEYVKILTAKKEALESLPSKLKTKSSVKEDIAKYDELIKQVTELVMSGNLPAVSADGKTDENGSKNGSTGANLAKISGAALGSFFIYSR